MHFRKTLQRLIDATMPHWQSHFLSYKLLKRQLKLIAGARQALAQAQDEAQPVTGRLPEEIEFARLLAREINKFNVFFTDMEEVFVMRLQDLKEKANLDPVRVLELRRDLVCLHGEMVLLENYSSLNCIGLFKILKKHDKINTSAEALLRAPFIRYVFQQPFFRTEMLREMIVECEERLSSLEMEQRSYEEEEEEEFFHNEENDVKRNTLAALHTIQHLRSGSSTYGPSSLRYQEFDEENSCTTL